MRRTRRRLEFVCNPSINHCAILRAVVDPLSHPQHIHLVSGSEEDTVHEYACQLLQGTCESDWSVPVTFQTLPACPSPTETEVVILSLTHDRATFDCTKPADQYQWRWRLPAGRWTTSAWSSNSAFDVSGLSENTSYRIECRLLCNGDESWWSLTESFQTLPAPKLPPPRLTDVICNHNNRTLRVAWTSTPGESFKIQVSMNGTTWMDEQPSWPAARN